MASCSAGLSFVAETPLTIPRCRAAPRNTCALTPLLHIITISKSEYTNIQIFVGSAAQGEGIPMNQAVHRFKAEFFKTLGHPARLAILDHLRAGEKSVNELQALLEADQSTISQQLARLRAGNLVDTRREGTTVYYSVRDPMVFQLMDVAREIFNRQLISHQTLMQQMNEEPEVP
jgi:ArsR family transcriptional regulator